MSKRNKIIYWVATVWLSLGMVSTGLVQLFKVESEVAYITGMGYPLFILNIIGIWKLLGVVVILLPKQPLLKEWAYAGFFFVMSGAIYSHIAVGNGIKDMGGPILLLVLTVVSWYFRPADKKISPQK
jgi:DoxX-like family